MSAWHLRLALHTVRSGGLLAYPTEAVWGLGCDPANLDALERLLALKQRPWQKGLILVASDWEQLAPWLRIAQPPPAAANAWPGHTTCLLPARADVSPLLRGTHDTLAVRITAHPLIRQLCSALQGPLVSSSANLHGRASPRRAWQVRAQLSAQLDFLLPGPLGQARQASRIMDPYSGQTIRP